MQKQKGGNVTLSGRIGQLGSAKKCGHTWPIPCPMGISPDSAHTCTHDKTSLPGKTIRFRQRLRLFPDLPTQKKNRGSELPRRSYQVLHLAGRRRITNEATKPNYPSETSLSLTAIYPTTGPGTMAMHLLHGFQNKRGKIANER